MNRGGTWPLKLYADTARFGALVATKVVSARGCKPARNPAIASTGLALRKRLKKRELWALQKGALRHSLGSGNRSE